MPTRMALETGMPIDYESVPTDVTKTWFKPMLQRFRKRHVHRT